MVLTYRRQIGFEWLEWFLAMDQNFRNQHNREEFNGIITEFEKGSSLTSLDITSYAVSSSDSKRMSRMVKKW